MGFPVVQSLDPDRIISYADDLIQVFNPKDISVVNEAQEELSRLKSFVDKDWSEVQIVFKDIEEKVLMHERKLEATEKESVDEDKLKDLCIELENKQQYEHQLCQELRMIEDEMNRLELERVRIESHKEALIKAKNDEKRAQNELSLYASVTNIIPDLNKREKYCGHIVNREKRIIETFEFERSTMSEVEICNRLWKMGEQ